MYVSQNQVSKCLGQCIMVGRVETNHFLSIFFKTSLYNSNRSNMISTWKEFFFLKKDIEW